MNITKGVLIAVTGLAGITALNGGSPAMAQSRYDRRDDRNDNRYMQWDRARNIEDILDLLYLDRGQRDKIHELTGKYHDRIRDIARNDRLRPSERQDKIWNAQRELRDRVLHVLTPRQRDRANDLMRVSRASRDRRW